MNDKTILGSLIASLSGRCRVCGCQGDSCSLEAGEKCCWVDAMRTLCSNPRCVTADGYAKKRHRRAARAGARRVTA